jgi:serine/threonine protein kinase
MGIVYRARQHPLHRLVALKMIRAGEFASETDRLRFYSEAELVGQLDHPHIVPILEVGEAQGQHFFSMKLIPGPSLAAWIAAYRVPSADITLDQQNGIARLIATVARAVHHAHQRGILHRDLKPANILLVASSVPETSAVSERGFIDFAHIKRQLPLARVLDHLALSARLRGVGAQRRCACPIHRTDGRGRTFSVNLDDNVFQCFEASCGKKGDVIDLWAALHQLSVRQAAVDLVQTFHLEPAPTAPPRGTEKRKG